MDHLSRFAQWIGADSAPEVRAADQVAHSQDPFLLEEDPDARDARVQQLLQQFSVLLEYEKLQDFAPPGMYVMPSLDSALTWHGTIFVRQGFYRGGVFKFRLTLPEDYPELPPELFFVSDVFHPMVEPKTGRIDIGAVFPEWRAGRDYASFVLPHLHRSLLRREYFSGSARRPLNVEARDLFLQDPSAFAERAAQCAQLSLQSVYQNPPGFSLKFTSGPAEAHDDILDTLRAADPSTALEDRKAMFVDWLCDHYAKQRVHVGVDSNSVETILLPSTTQEDQ